MLETQARPPRQNRVSSQLTRQWVTRLIATLGIALMTIGLFVPSASRDVIVHGDPVSRFTETWVIWTTSVPWILQHVVHMGRLSFLMQLAVGALYSVLALGGLGLIPGLWLARDKEAVWVRWTYAFWLLVLVLMALASIPSWWQFSSQTIPGQLSHVETIGASALLPGAVVFPFGTMTGGAALVLLLREPVTAVATVPASRTG